MIPARVRIPSVLRSGLAALAVLLTATVATAQPGYFGQNKVQYETFKFQVLQTEHFDIYFYPEEEAAARMAARMAERWYTRLSTLLNHNLRGRQPLVLYASAVHFRQTNTVQGDIGEGTGGVTEAFKRRIVLPFAGPVQATDHVLGHELVHAFQYDISGTDVSSNTAGALALPLWFIEGMAEYLSVGPVDPHTAMWMREAARREKLPTIDELNSGRYFPYRYGQALWAFIGGKYGDRVIGDVLRAGSGTGDYRNAFEQILGVKTDELSKQWQAAEFEAYRPIAETTKVPGAVARPLVGKARGGGGLNVSPELSPDGSRMMFFSERDLFSIDLYLADARTGEVIRKVTDTATDPHYESLQFLSSAGAWDPSGKRFIFPGIAKGRPTLTIINPDNGRREREIRIDDVDEILNPAWSPDGNRIAFSGLAGGFNDLFVYDLTSNQLGRLTNDSYAELDPAWSPDGRQIAFSTDRSTTRLDSIDAGHLKLAVIDVESRAIREFGGFEGAKNISPQWSADGRSLFFLSDRQGVTNIYRAPVDGGAAMQLTNLLTGVSGITPLSPAMSAGGGRIVFSAYEEDNYNVYALDTETQLAGVGLVDLPRNAALLPPRSEPGGPVYTALQNETAGLPPASVAEAEAEPYKPKFSLDYAGQPTIGIGADPFGTYATGGVSFLFSDMLGNHTLATYAQVTSRFDEFGGGVMYINKSRRWNWGVALDQTPYVARAWEQGIDPVQNVYVENEYRVLQVDRSASGTLSYPFGRALRAEVTGGFRQIAYSQDVTSRYYSLSSGQQIGEEEQEIGSFPTLNLGQVSSALVYDTSIMGATSPIRGSRSRLEFSQSGGSLTYSGVLADARTYLMPVRPFTIAVRGLYYGRFGEDAEDARLPTLYLGYPSLMRGYDSNSFESGECGFASDGSCPAFDRLVGSRLGVVNAELRFPLLGLFRPDNYYGAFPVEMALFSDAGIAWGRATYVGSVEGDHEPVVSVGAALRVNLFGFAVAEIDYVKPLDRPLKGWMWQFSLRPGF